MSNAQKHTINLSAKSKSISKKVVLAGSGKEKGLSRVHMNDSIPFNLPVAGALTFFDNEKDPDYCVFKGERFYRVRKGYTSYMNF